MESNQKLENVLKSLKDIKPALQEQDVLADMIMKRITNQPLQKQNTIITILKYTSASIAAILVLIFLQQSFFHSSSNRKMIVNDNAQFVEQQHNLKIDRSDMLKSILLHTKKREQNNEVMKNISAQYITSRF